MGTNLPSSNKDSLVWLEGIIATWNANYAAIGLTSAQTINLSLNVANTRAAFTTVSDIRTESKAKTLDANAKAKALHAEASAMISTIKGFARASNDPAAVYLASGISPADPPSPVAPPGTPVIDNAVLIANGAVKINFSGTGPVGTVWQVNRKLTGETEYAFIGTADPTTKSYIDNTIPVGTDSAMYTVTGQRGAEIGLPSLTATVQFGSVQGVGDGAAASEAA